MRPPAILRRFFDPASPRGRAIGLFVATSLAGRAVGVVSQLLQVPIAVHALGPEAFGLWMALTSVSFVILFADFGVGQGAQNRLAESLALGRGRESAELVGTTLVFMTAVGAVLALAVALATGQADFTRLFHLTEPLVRREARPAVALSLLLCCANFPLGFAQRLAYARQEGWAHNFAQAAGSLGSLAGVAMAAFCHASLPGFIVAAQVPPLVSNGLLLGWLLFRTRGQLSGAPACRLATLRELLRLGMYFGIQQVHITLLLALPQVLISVALGAAAVTPYNLAQRLFNMFAIIQNAFMLPLWPAYSEARARGDFAWIRRTLKLSLAATAVCTLAPMALGAALARPLIAFWLGQRAVLPTAGLVWALFLWNAVVFLEQPFGYLLAGLSEVRKVTRYSIIGGMASALFMVVGVRQFGPEGLVYGMLLGFLPYLTLGAMSETARVLRTVLRPRAAPGAPAWTGSLAPGGQP